MAPSKKGSRTNVLDPQQIVEEASEPFVGRWNQLVSTTNWEKGRIISQWRDELAAADSPPTEYSDEAWGRLVGGVTGQHVGRLRRVYQRFGEVYETYDGLYWSHFHAALDWDDAEMWLEGAVQSHWSVSQMRKTRWETLDDQTPEPTEAEVVAGELDEDFEPALNSDPLANSISGVVKEVVGGPETKSKKKSDEGLESRKEKSNSSGASIYASDRVDETVPFVRPFENLAELPDDLADAFESFKLAILRHKADDWQQISRDDVLGSLDALKELALAPSMEESPF